MKIGVNAVMLTNVFSPILDNDGSALFTAQEGDRVFVVSLEPLMVKKVDNQTVFSVQPEWIKVLRGRPRRITD